MKEFLESSDLLETVATESARVNDEARQVVTGLTSAQLNWKPAPESWSIAQCLEHLTLSSANFDRYFAPVIARAKEKGATSSPPAYRPTMIGGWLIRQLVPEATRKVPAPKILRPSASNLEQPLEHFLRQQEAFLGFVSSARGIDYNKARLRSPVTPLIRYSLADAFVLTVVHNRRHLSQARRVKATTGFPG
jgi:hypothetical protein